MMPIVQGNHENEIKTRDVEVAVPYTIPYQYINYIFNKKIRADVVIRPYGI